MAQPKEKQIPKYGEKKVKSPHCIILWSSAAKSAVCTSQKNVENKLLCKNIRLEQLDGEKPENKISRNQLFNISRKKGQYPQIFIKDKNKQIKFIGMEADINFLIESDNFDKVFACCMTNNDSNIVNKKAEASRYKKLAEQWFGANNLFKAQKFARKSLRLDATKEVKQLLDKIQELQSQSQSMQLRENDSMDIEIYDEEEKINVPMMQPMAKPVLKNIVSDDIKAKSQKKVTAVAAKTNDASHELVNQLLEQSMTLEQRVKQLEKENKTLKQKLSAAQNVHYEKQKNKVKGCVYECNLVKEYNSKQRNNIRIRKEIETLQIKINNKMNGHKNRLNEWKKHTLHLEREFLKDNKDTMDKKKEENDEEENDEKKMDCNKKLNQNNSNQILNVTNLYLSYKNCLKLLSEQQQRTEDVMTHCIDLNSETANLRTIIKKYNINVPDTKNKYDKLCKNYDSLKNDRETLQLKVQNLVIAINNLIDRENEINNSKCLTLDKYNLLTQELDKYNKLLTISRKLTNKYSDFEENVENKSNEFNKYFQLQWDKHERNWSDWDINGIICWFKYLMHDKKLRLSKTFNLKIIGEKMCEQQIRGASLNKMDKSDLKLCGFTIFDDRDQTYKAIRALVEKYPGIQDRLISFSGLSNNITAAAQKEGQEIKIPKEYLCPITNKIMVNPVVAYDNITYEKENIVKYIKKYKKTPNCKHECDGDEPLLRNKQLKTKIEQFLWANPQIQIQQ